MRQAHRRGRLVDLLAARAARAVYVHLDVRRVDLDFDGVVDFGHDFQGSERSMAPSGGIERRHAHQAVYPALAFQETIGVFAFNEDAGAFEARLFAVQIVQGTDLKVVALSPAAVHAVEHFRPVLRFGPACARVEGEDGVLVVILAVEQRRKALRLQAFTDFLQFILGLGQQGFIPLLVAELDQSHRVVISGGQFLIRRNLILQRAGAL